MPQFWFNNMNITFPFNYFKNSTHLIFRKQNKMTEYSKPIDKRIMYHQGVTFQIKGEEKKIWNVKC